MCTSTFYATNTESQCQVSFNSTKSTAYETEDSKFDGIQKKRKILVRLSDKILIQTKTEQRQMPRCNAVMTSS